MENKHVIDFSENNIITISLYQWDKGQTFVFDKDYNGKELQFSDGSVKIINNDIATVPDLLLQTSGSISAWVQVIDTDGETTIKKIVINVKPRAKKDDYIQPEDEPTFREQIEEILDETKAVAESVRADADAGIFDGENGEDGFSPVVSVEEIEGGHRVNITDKSGTKSFDVLDGQGTSGGMSYYLVTCDMIHFYHDGVVLTYADLVDKYNDEKYFLYAECNGLTFIPSLPPLEEDPIIEFINTSIYGGVATITRLIINSDNEVKYNDVVVAEKSDIPAPYDDTEIRQDIANVNDKIDDILGTGDKWDYELGETTFNGTIATVIDTGIQCLNNSEAKGFEIATSIKSMVDNTRCIFGTSGDGIHRLVLMAQYQNIVKIWYRGSIVDSADEIRYKMSETTSSIRFKYVYATGLLSVYFDDAPVLVKSVDMTPNTSDLIIGAHGDKQNFFNGTLNYFKFKWL